MVMVYPLLSSSVGSSASARCCSICMRWLSAVMRAKARFVMRIIVASSRAVLLAFIVAKMVGMRSASLLMRSSSACSL